MTTIPSLYTPRSKSAERLQPSGEMGMGGGEIWDPRRPLMHMTGRTSRSASALVVTEARWLVSVAVMEGADMSSVVSCWVGSSGKKPFYWTEVVIGSLRAGQGFGEGVEPSRPGFPEVRVFDGIYAELERTRVVRAELSLDGGLPEWAGRFDHLGCTSYTRHDNDVSSTRGCRWLKATFVSGIKYALPSIALK